MGELIVSRYGIWNDTMKSHSGDFMQIGPYHFETLALSNAAWSEVPIDAKPRTTGLRFCTGSEDGEAFLALAERHGLKPFRTDTPPHPDGQKGEK